MDDKKIDKKESPKEQIDVIQSLLQNEDPSDTTEYLKNRISKQLTEEQELWLDVMTVGIWDYIDSLNTKDTTGRNLFNEVFDWVFNWAEDPIYLGTFENICNHLDINPSVIRGRLIKYTKQHYHKVQEARPSVILSPITTVHTNSIYVSKSSILNET